MNYPENRDKKDRSLANLERITRLMDSKFELLGIKFGLDPILNLIPFVGNAVSIIVSALLIDTMSKHGASDKVKAKMLLNVCLDALISMIPVLGWVFDFYFKANERNLILLKQHYQEGKYQGNAGSVIWPVIIGILVLVLVIGYVAWKIVSGIFAWIFAWV